MTSLRRSTIWTNWHSIKKGNVSVAFFAIYVEELFMILNNETKTLAEKEVRAVLAAVCMGDSFASELSLDELESLLNTAGGVAVARVVQNLESPNTKTYIGTGKAKEIAEFVANDGEIDLVVFDNELTPSQLNNLEELIGVRVIDRTMLILDIFALHAVTGEGKMQVEIACLRYTAPRLTGKGKELSRLGGGIGTRGPGESKLESDRRHIKRRISALEEELREMERTRITKRAARDKKSIKSAVIVGYTNSGKSTLLNYLTDAGILAENKLFATLDPTTRLLTTEGGEELLLTDTVGFIDGLPHHLIKAFKSTLDELKYADMIISVTDASEEDSRRRRKMQVTEKLIEELCGEHKPIVRVFNKIDKVEDRDFIPPDAIEISALSGMGIDKLVGELENLIRGGRKVVSFKFPPSAAGLVSSLYAFGEVLETEYNDDGSISVKACCEEKEIGRLTQYIID